MVKFFVAATGLAAVAADYLDCSTYNGGCSHVCNSVTNLCECPPLWGLDDDGMNCLPVPGMVTTTCGSNTIKMTISASVLDKHDWTGAFVGDDNQNNACKLTLSEEPGEDGNDVYVLEHGLEECGTILEYVDATDALRFNVSYQYYAVKVLTLSSEPLIFY